MLTLKDKIAKANKSYSEYLSACDSIAMKAQKYILWNDAVGCSFLSSDGLCIEIDARVCPAVTFFNLVLGSDQIDEETYYKHCI